MTQKTEAEREVTDLPYSDPDELASGQPMPFFDHVFRTGDGQRKKVRMQGLPYAEKSVEDVRAQQEKAEDTEKGIVRSDLRAARLIAKAVRTADGKRRYVKEEDQILFAIKISEQMADGEINRGYNALMERSGYGKDALAEAGKD